VCGFSEVRLTDHAHQVYADTIRELDTAITLHLDTFRRLRLAGGDQDDPGTTTPEGDGGDQDDGSKTFNRSKLACDCYPERSIRVSPKQAARGPILCGVCGAEFQPEGDGQR